MIEMNNFKINWNLLSNGNTKQELIQYNRETDLLKRRRQIFLNLDSVKPPFCDFQRRYFEDATQIVCDWTKKQCWDKTSCTLHAHLIRVSTQINNNAKCSI